MIKRIMLLLMALMMLGACVPVTTDVSPFAEPLVCPTPAQCQPTVTAEPTEEVFDWEEEDDDIEDFGAMSFGVGKQSYSWLTAKRLTVVNESDLQGDVSMDGALDVTGALDVDGATTLNSTLDVDGAISSGTGAVTVTEIAVSGLFYPSFTNITVTNGYTLTASYTVYAMDSASAVTLTLAASASEGQLLILIGDDANNITVADTNIRTNDGAKQVIGQYDVLMLVYQDSEWVEISESNNS